MVILGIPWKKSPLTSAGMDSGTFRLVEQCLNHYATPGPKIMLMVPVNMGKDFSSTSLFWHFIMGDIIMLPDRLRV